MLAKPKKVQVGSATRVSLEFSGLYHYMRNWLRAVVFQLNLKYLHVKITNLLRIVV